MMAIAAEHPGHEPRPPLPARKQAGDQGEQVEISFTLLQLFLLPRRQRSLQSGKACYFWEAADFSQKTAVAVQLIISTTIAKLV
jgi:hypothetical protein